MKIQIKKDGEGYLATVKGCQHLFAYGHSKEEALDELSNVIDMTMDFHLEQVNQERQAMRELINTRLAYAV